MKQGMVLFAALFILSGVMPGCKKKNNNTVTPSADAFLKASIGDSSFSVSGAGMAYATKSSSAGIDYLYIYGVTNYGKAIQISLLDFSGAKGTVTFGTGDGSAYFYPNGFTGGGYSYSVSGSVTFTSVSPDLVGTFSFACADSTQVKSGSFTVKAP